MERNGEYLDMWGLTEVKATPLCNLHRGDQLWWLRAFLEGHPGSSVQD